MSNEVVKFDSLSTIEAIREKIRSAIFDTIPQANWDALIQQEIQSFMTTRVEGRGTYNERTVQSKFSIIVNEEIEKALREALKTKLADPEFAKNLLTDIPNTFATILAERGPELIKSWLMTAVIEIANNAARNVAYQAQNNGQPRYG